MKVTEKELREKARALGVIDKKIQVREDALRMLEEDISNLRKEYQEKQASFRELVRKLLSEEAANAVNQEKHG